SQRAHRPRGAGPREGRHHRAETAAAHRPHSPAARPAVRSGRPDPGGGPVPAPDDHRERPAASAAAGPFSRVHRPDHRSAALLRVRSRAGRARRLSYPDHVNAVDPEQPADTALAADDPQPRRTRRGAVIVGPSIGARYRPGALIGLPLISLVLSPFAGAGIQQWLAARTRTGHEGRLEQLLASAWSQLLIGWLLLWALFALWAIVPMVLTHRVALLEQSTCVLLLRRGPRIVDAGEARCLRVARRPGAVRWGAGGTPLGDPRDRLGRRLLRRAATAAVRRRPAPRPAAARPGRRGAAATTGRAPPRIRPAPRHAVEGGVRARRRSLPGRVRPHPPCAGRQGARPARRSAPVSLRRCCAARAPRSRRCSPPPAG